METTTSLEQVVAELRQLRETVAALQAKIDSLLTYCKMPTSHPHIYTSLAMHQGEPTIRGSSITVRTIVEQSRLSSSVEDILEAYPFLTAAQVHDALSYYYDHPKEIENYIRENQEALWRMTRPGST